MNNHAATLAGRRLTMLIQGQLCIPGSVTTATSQQNTTVIIFIISVLILNECVPNYLVNVDKNYTVCSNKETWPSTFECNCQS